MPSGAKKRKAQKRKKATSNNNNINNNNNSSDNSSSVDSNNKSSQGNDDPRSHDERESYGGEVRSPLPQDHHDHDDPDDEQNRESEKTDPSPEQPLIIEDEPVEFVNQNEEISHKVEFVDDNTVETVGEPNPKQDVGSEVARIEDVVSVKESHDGDDRRFSHSSYDDESQSFEKKQTEESYNSVLDETASNDKEKAVNDFSEELTQIFENGKQVQETNSNPVLENVRDVDLVTPVVPMPEVGKCVMESAQAMNPEVPEVVESGFEDNNNKSLPTSDKVYNVSVNVLGVEEEDEFFPVADKNVGASSNLVGFTAGENEDKMLMISGVHPAEKSIESAVIKASETSDDAVSGNEISTLARAVETSKDPETVKGYDASEFTENQPLIASAPGVAQKTLWMSCCGLFDAFTRSGR